MTIDVAVDLRASQGGVRNQGTRPTCLAFVLSDLNRLHSGSDEHLSAEYLYASAARQMSGWLPGHGLELQVGLQAVASPGQPHEIHCPYETQEPKLPWGPHATYDPMLSAKVRVLPALLSEVVDQLTAGNPVGIAVNVTPELFTPTDGVVSFSYMVVPGHLHALLVVGLGRHSMTGEAHVLVRNSWGESWGENGHAWLSATHIEVHAVSMFGV